MSWTKIMECVPNFSEGRDLKKIDQIVNPFRGKEGVKLLDYSNDEDHNRLVVTVVGEPEPLRDAVLETTLAVLYGAPDEGVCLAFNGGAIDVGRENGAESAICAARASVPKSTI